MSQQKTITRVTQRTVLPEGADLFSERAFVVSIQAVRGGEFVEIKSLLHGSSVISIDTEEWPALRDAINASMSAIEEHEQLREGSGSDYVVPANSEDQEGVDYE